MSQEKVARYKEEKANRKETMKKQKRQKMIRNSVAGIVCLAVIGWVGYSAVEYYQNNKQRESVEVDFGAINDYIEGISAE